MTVFLTVDLVVILTLAFGFQTKTSFLEYLKQVIFQYDGFLRTGLGVRLKLTLAVLVFLTELAFTVLVFLTELALADTNISY